MKNRTIAFALIGLALMTSCGKDVSVDCIYTAHTENIIANKTGSATKAETSDLKAVKWSEGDKIKVFKASEIKSADAQGMDFTLTGAAGTPSAQFTAAGSGSYNKAKSYAVYPAEIVKGHTGTVVKVELPAVQHYKEGGFAPESFASVATGSSKEEMLFQNLCGVLVLKLTNSSQLFSVASLSITTKSDESICGTGTVDFNYKETPELVMDKPASDAQKTVKLVCDPPVLLTASATFFCFAIPAGKLASGFSLYVNDELYGQMALDGPANKNTIFRSESRTIASSIAYTPTAVNPETTLKGLAVTYTSGVYAQAPQITGTDNGWKIYWGDGSSDAYSPLLTHTYLNAVEAVSVYYNFENVQTVTFPSLAGISTVYVTNL